jgi:putative transposase
MTRKSYQSDLSQAEWLAIQPLLPVPKTQVGRKRLHEQREILNAIFWITAAGCAWRMLAHDFPAWQTVYHYFRLWRKNGLWKKIHDQIRHHVRVAEAREPEASAAYIDSQSVKAVGLRGEHGVLVE